MEKCPIKISRNLISYFNSLRISVDGNKENVEQILEFKNIYNLLIEKKEELFKLFLIERDLDLKITEKIFTHFLKENSKYNYNSTKIVLLFHLSLLVDSEIILENQIYQILKSNKISSKEIYNGILWAEGSKIKEHIKNIIEETENNGKTTSKDINDIIGFFINEFIPKLKNINKSGLSRDMFYTGKFKEFLSKKEKEKDKKEGEKRNDELSFKEGENLANLLNEKKELFFLAIKGKNSRDEIIDGFNKIMCPSKEFISKTIDTESANRGKIILSTGLMDIFSISLLIKYGLINKSIGISVLIAGMLSGNSFSLGSINKKVQDYLIGQTKEKEIIGVLKSTYIVQKGKKYASCPFYYSPERNETIEKIIDLFLNEIIPMLEKSILPEGSGKLLKFYSGQLN